MKMEAGNAGGFVRSLGSNRIGRLPTLCKAPYEQKPNDICPRCLIGAVSRRMVHGRVVV